MNSKNEWDPLEEVIVGNAAGARIPSLDISVRTVNYADQDNPPQGNREYPKKITAQAQDDLDLLSTFLTGVGVKVHRPADFFTPYYHYCPRDLAFIHGNRALATPMSIKCRRRDWVALRPHLTNLTLAPQYDNDDLYNLDCVGNPDILALTEVAPCFDAANILRANNDILYLVSNSGNHAGAEYLQEYLGDSVRVHKLEGVYSYMHIDSTIAFLREGLMLINPERISDPKTQLPEPFASWDYIKCPEPTDIGYTDYCNASKWINMNLFSLNPNVVVLERHQQSLAQELKKYNIESVMLPMRHQRTLGGGFHCVTLDLVRQHG